MEEEINGLLSYDREDKLDAPKVRAGRTRDVPVFTCFRQAVHAPLVCVGPLGHGDDDPEDGGPQVRAANEALVATALAIRMPEASNARL